MDNAAVPADLAAAIALGGEMGRRFAAYDWAAHPLGPLAGWPVEVRANVATALTSRFPIVLWLGGQDLFLVYNDAYLPVLGDKHPAALGRPGRDVWWDIWDAIGPMLASVVTTGTATWSDDLLLLLVTAGRPWERYFTFSYGPMITVDGDVDGVFCAVNETTERVLGQRRLHILNAVAAELMEARTVEHAVRAVVDCCAAYSADLPFVGLYLDDPATGTGHLRGATPLVDGHLPASLATIAPPPGTTAPHVLTDLARWLPALPSAFDTGQPEQALIIPVAEPEPGVTRGALLIGLSPRQTLDEQYRGFCRLLADQVSAALATIGSYERERHRADALAELDRAKTTFLTNVSHEFRTPLTLLLGPVEDAIADAHGQPQQLERLTTVHRNARRLLRLVNSLLDFARTQTGNATPTRTRLDVGELTAQIASSFTELCQRAGIDLNIKTRPVLGDIDVEMWETVVLNLLSNAVKFTLTGSITLEVTPTDTGIQVTVRDTGTGIPKADLNQLFDRFYRAGNTRGRSVEGAGIGLSLVRGLVELHGGTISIDSELDVGTTVTIDLPGTDQQALPAAVPDPPVGRRDTDNPYVAEALQWLATDQASPVAAQPSTSDISSDVPSDEGRPLVLVADDNADMRRYLHRILSTQWNAVVFGDGQTALDAVRQRRPDVIVTDVMMPGLDGFGFVAAIRADPLLASIPILMLSARAGTESAAEGFASGADDYLPKPFSSEDLRNRVAARLDAAQRERASHEHDEARTQRATALAAFTATLNAATSLPDILTALLADPANTADATTAALALPEETSDQVRIHFGGPVPAELRDRYHMLGPTAPVPVIDVLRTGDRIVMTDTLETDPRFRLAVQDARDTIRASVIQPLHDGDSILGALALHWAQPRRFTRAELDTVTRTAAITATAVRRVRTAQREHRIAIDFQDHLLDLNQSSHAAVVSAVYQPAAQSMRVGGDWYLVAPMTDPAQVGVSVGDVVGHGLPAATVMSKLRSATTTAALAAADPQAVLTLVERYAASVPGARCSTVAYALVDTGTRTVSYACAGHPYPLVVTPAGATRYLEQGRRRPLAAVGLTTSGPIGQAELPPGCLLILYTDGLVERPGESLQTGFAQLATFAADCRDLPAGAACSELLTRMQPPDGYTDDVAILVVRPVGITPTSFVTTLPADATATPPTRQRLRAWLTEQGIDPQIQHDLLLAVGEAITNAIEHGSALDPAKTVGLEVFLREDAITVTVSDSGQWSRDSSASHRVARRGRGLTLINGLADRVDTVRTSRGTRITLRFNRRASGARA